MPPTGSANSARAALERILSPAFLRTLGRLRLSVRQALGRRPGNTPMRGAAEAAGIEFERHKGYQPGDELRFLDWNAYARLDQLLVKRFRPEREAPLHIFVDASASMGVPQADEKFSFAVAIAVALAYVAARRQDPARIVALGSAMGRTGFAASPIARAPVTLDRLSTFCAGLHPGGETTLVDGIAAYSHSLNERGLAVVVSDFLVPPERWRESLRLFGNRGFEVAAVRPLGNFERDPGGHFRAARLRDAESGAERVVRLSRAHLDHYRRNLSEHLEALRRECARHGAAFIVADTARDIEYCLFHQLPATGVLR